MQSERPMPNGADPPVAGRTLQRLPDAESRRRTEDIVFIRSFQAGKKNTARWPCFFNQKITGLDFGAPGESDETDQRGAEQPDGCWDGDC